MLNTLFSKLSPIINIKFKLFKCYICNNLKLLFERYKFLLYKFILKNKILIFTKKKIFVITTIIFKRVEF